MFKVKSCIVSSILAFAIILSSAASATVVDFEDRTGPNVFADAIPIPQTLIYGPATFTGGVILSNTSFLPGNTTSVYGTASFVSGMSNPLTITFSSAVTNVFFDLYNGLTTSIDYLISDNVGNSASFTLGSNSSGGHQLVGFAATGSIITIASTTSPTSYWDFFIDNIHYNEALPPTLNPVPEPEIYAMLGVGLGLMGWVGRRRKLQAA